jgi:ATP dependent DNA ligase domain
MNVCFTRPGIPARLPYIVVPCCVRVPPSRSDSSSPPNRSALISHPLATTGCMKLSSWLPVVRSTPRLHQRPSAHPDGYDWTDRYPSVLAALKSLQITSCLIDGEVVVTNARGLAVFNALRYGDRVKPHAVLLAFDLLELDGEDFREFPIEVRKRQLARLCDGAPAGLQLVEPFTVTVPK